MKFHHIVIVFPILIDTRKQRNTSSDEYISITAFFTRIRVESTKLQFKQLMKFSIILIISRPIY